MLAEQKTILNDEQRMQFWREGYLVVDEVFSDEEVQVLRDALSEVERRGPVDESVTTFTGDYLMIHRSLGTVSDPLRRAAVHPRLLQTVQDLMLEQVSAKSNGSLLDKLPGEQSWDIIWHQDHGGYEHREQTYFITARVALDDVSPDNGGMYVLPGTHFILMETDRGISVKSEQYNEIREIIRQRYDHEPGISVLRKAGSVLFYAPLLLHRAGHNVSTSRRRILVYAYRPASLMLKGREWPSTVFPDPLVPVKSLLED